MDLSIIQASYIGNIHSVGSCLFSFIVAAADYGGILSLETQLSYPVSSETRTAINDAYSGAQKYVLITATAIHLISLLSVAVRPDIKAQDIKQVKGVVV